MSFKLAIIDDDQEDLERIKKLVGEKMECICFQDVKVFDTKTYYDALFLDIDMPEKSGLDLAREYRTLHPNTCIVLLQIIMNLSIKPSIHIPLTLLEKRI